MTSPTLGVTVDGAPLELDIERLVATRMLLTANSGAGKSWALRRLLEQTHGRIQQLVLDPEGEFYTLRERFDYVLAGRGGDCPADPRSAALLARRLLELGTSAVLDLYELIPRERVRFVRLFLESLIDAPRSLWHPVLVVLDEAHVYAPESGKAESVDAVARLMAQGRKRGFAGILATQRLSKLAKDVAAEANNLLLGRAALDVDVKRVGETLGLTKAAAAAQLRALKPGHFFAFGPALSADVVELVVGDVATSHPKAGKKAAPPAPPRAKVKKVLGQLADLPKEAEAEATSLAEAKLRIRELERKLRVVEKAAEEAAAAAPPPKIERVEVPVVGEETVAELRALIAEQLPGLAAGQLEALTRYRDLTDRLDATQKRLRDLLYAPLVAGPRRVAAEPQPIPKPRVEVVTAPVRAGATRVGRELASISMSAKSGEARMLAVLAQHFPTGLREGQWAALAGLKRSGGTWSTYKSRLRTAGYLREEGGLFLATEEGVAAAGVVPELPTSVDEVVELWRGKAGMRPVMPIVEAVLAEPGIERAALAERVGLTATGGTFSTYLSRARTAELIADEGGGVVPGAAFRWMP